MTFDLQAFVAASIAEHGEPLTLREKGLIHGFDWQVWFARLDSGMVEVSVDVGGEKAVEGYWLSYRPYNCTMSRETARELLASLPVDAVVAGGRERAERLLNKDAA